MQIVRLNGVQSLGFGCSGLLLLLLIGLVVFLLPPFYNRYQLWGAGVEAQATVLDKHRELVEDSDGENYHVQYRFEAPAAHGDGMQEVTYSQMVTEEVYNALQPGDTLAVRYLPEDPTVCGVQEGDEVLHIALRVTGLVLVFPGLPMLLFVIHGVVQLVQQQGTRRQWRELEAAPGNWASTGSQAYTPTSIDDMDDNKAPAAVSGLEEAVSFDERMARLAAPTRPAASPRVQPPVPSAPPAVPVQQPAEAPLLIEHPELKKLLQYVQARGSKGAACISQQGEHWYLSLGFIAEPAERARVLALLQRYQAGEAIDTAVLRRVGQQMLEPEEK
jgi:hypothetical protein